jgi:uncharacterized membrane protein YgcG
MALFFFKLCRVYTGSEPNPNAVVSQAAITPASSVATRRFKLSSIINQMDDTEITPDDSVAMALSYARWQSLYGPGSYPAENEDATPEQLGALRHLLDTHQTLYTDFSVWGPHGNRILKQMRLLGGAFNRDGSISTIEIRGPPDFATWANSWKVFQTACVLLDVADLSTMANYHALIEKYHSRYGPSCWMLIYQADVRTRLEQAARTKRKLSIEYDAAQKSGRHFNSTYDPTRPWDAVYKDMITDRGWWHDQLEEPSLMLLGRTTTLDQLVSGDAAVAANGIPNLGGNHGITPLHNQHGQGRGGGGGGRGNGGGGGGGGGDGGGGGPPRQRANANKRDREREVPNQHGTYTKNRAGKKLCDAYQQGSCGATVGHVLCPSDRSMVHQCNRCLAPGHGGNNCPPPVPRAPDAGKGAGKGKGKGKKR